MKDVISNFKKENNTGEYTFSLDKGRTTNPTVTVSENNIVVLNDFCYENDSVKKEVKEKILDYIVGNKVDLFLHEKMEIIEKSYENAKELFDKNNKIIVLKNYNKIYDLKELNCSYAIVYLEDIEVVNFYIRSDKFNDGLTIRITKDGNVIPVYSTKYILSNISDEEIKERKKYLELFISYVLNLGVSLDDNNTIKYDENKLNERLAFRAFKLAKNSSSFRFKDNVESNAYANLINRNTKQG